LAEVHLNQIDPNDFEDQERAFKAGALSVCALLFHDFSALGDRYQKSRELDPIVAVCPTGIFDFFVKAFGVDWLKWWEAGRPAEWGEITELISDPQIKAYSPEATDLFVLLEAGYTHLSHYFREREEDYLINWRSIVERTVKEYCDRHGLKAPNRATALQPSGTKSLLTGASPGFHPPKAAYMIRRITVRKNHPVAMAAIALGYSVLPSQSDKDENGVLLNDPFDPRCTEWLIEIPMKTIWADLEGCADIDVSKFSAVAQFDFYMQVQKHYTRHNSSATLEMRENEIEPLAKCIYDAIQNDDGYISAALLARYDDVQTYPRLPFEPTDRAKYQELEAAIAQRRTQKETALAFRLKEAGITSYDFDSLYRFYDQGDALTPETAACDTGLCEMKETLEQIKSDSFTVEVL
jgi:ribonucleotide reductase, class II